MLVPRTVSKEARLRLCNEEVGEWVALSHRWGGQKFLTITLTNLQEHCQRLPWTSLSKTFQDAIALTRQFGLRYPWIDSLCILKTRLMTG